MPAQKRVKKAGGSPQLVGVIASRSEIKLAARIPSPPELVELRLDCLAREPGLERAVRELRLPFIITARHPAEGGKNHLATAIRNELLLRFLPLARYVDIELRSVDASRAVLEAARRRGVGIIISFHDLGSTPTLGSLRAKAARARHLRPAVFKVATRTDNPVQLSRLLQFISSSSRRLPICAMGMGKLGAVSRLMLAQCGSVFVYTSLNTPQVEGQIGLDQFRSALCQIGYGR